MPPSGPAAERCRCQRSCASLNAQGSSDLLPQHERVDRPRRGSAKRDTGERAQAVAVLPGEQRERRQQREPRHAREDRQAGDDAGRSEAAALGEQNAASASSRKSDSL